MHIQQWKMSQETSKFLHFDHQIDKFDIITVTDMNHHQLWQQKQLLEKVHSLLAFRSTCRLF